MLRKGGAQIRTTPMHGLIQHIVVSPSHVDTVWSMDILDRDNDLIYTRRDCEGRLDDKEGLPVGRDKPECLDIILYDATANEKFNVMFKVKDR